MKEDDICVIIPTIRDYECVKTYVKNAEEHNFDTDRLHFVLVTEDFCDSEDMREMLEELGVKGRVFDGTKREEWMEENGLEDYKHLIPEASHAQTSFGLLYMWSKPRFEKGIFIDDDTLPKIKTDYFRSHLSNLNSKGRDIKKVGSDKNWVNVLFENFEEHGLYPRGYPYSAMGEEVEEEYSELEKEVVGSQGLWTNIPDLDAVRILMDGDLNGQAQTLTSVEDFKRNFVVKEGNYLTVCSMNFAFKREIIPVFYQLPMDDNQWEVGRFDDIWSGVNLKKACDVLGKQLVSGKPLCVHNKAERSTFSDLFNEVAGLELNEHYWEIIDDVEGDDYFSVAENIALALREAKELDYINSGFYSKCGEYLFDWLCALESIRGDNK